MLTLVGLGLAAWWSLWISETQPRVRAFPFDVAAFFVGPVYALFIVRFAPRSGPQLARVGLLNGELEPGLFLPLRSGRLPAWIIAQTSVALGLAYMSIDDSSPSPSGAKGIWFLIALALFAADATLLWRSRRGGFGLAFTPSGLQTHGLFRDLYVPWTSISLVGDQPGTYRQTVLVLDADRAQVLVAGVGRIPVEKRPRPIRLLIEVTGLPAAEEVVVAAVSNFRQDEEARAGIGSSGSLARFLSLRATPRFASDGSELRWAARVLGRTILAFPVLLVAVGTVVLALQHVWFGRNDWGFDVFILIWLGATFPAPFLAADVGRYNLVSKLGCRRTVTFAGVAIGWIGVMGLLGAAISAVVFST